jgi:hypothetical protein
MTSLSYDFDGSRNGRPRIDDFFCRVFTFMTARKVDMVPAKSLKCLYFDAISLIGHFF